MIGPIVGSNLRRLRGREGLTQEDAAQCCRQYGLPWSRPQIASLETGRRADLNLGEMMALVSAFHRPLAYWVQGADVDVEVFVRGGIPLIPMSVPPRPGYGIERYIARKLGKSVPQIRACAELLWDRPLADEREARLPDGGGKTARIAVTRSLIAEMRAIYGQTP